MRRGFHQLPEHKRRPACPNYTPEQWNALFEAAMANTDGITHVSLTEDGPEVIPDPDITSIQ